MKIAIITDSYGGLRVHDGKEEVSQKQTYPYLLKEMLESQGHTVVCDSAVYRRVVDLPEIIKGYSGYDIYIFQAGIVDIYPRPLSFAHTMSQAFFWKLYRRIIRLNRKLYLRFINNITWSSEKEIHDSIKKVSTDLKSSKILWVNVCHVNAYMDSITPGANKSIDRFNTLLHEAVRDEANAQVVDVCISVNTSAEKNNLLHHKDAHLTVSGNTLYALEIANRLKDIYLN